MNGTLIVDKAAGMTSHDVVARVRRIIGERRVGHTGTLDPFATGVLVILIGKATRLLQFLSGAEKEYEALIRFGYATDSGDATGQRLDVHPKAQSPQSLRRDEIEAAMASLRGAITQVPPMYSAKKVKGRKLYELARRGERIERQPVPVTINEFSCVEVNGQLLRMRDDGTVDLNARVVCSAGTYVRTLAEDLGEQLGVPAHLVELRRTRAGRFGIDEGRTLERLTELAESGSLEQTLVSPDATLAQLPALNLSAEDVRRVMNGMDLRVETGAWTAGQAIRLRGAAGELIGVGLYDEALRLVHPRVVFGT